MGQRGRKLRLLLTSASLSPYWTVCPVSQDVLSFKGTWKCALLYATTPFSWGAHVSFSSDSPRTSAMQNALGANFFFFNMKHLMNLHVILMLKPR